MAMHFASSLSSSSGSDIELGRSAASGEGCTGDWCGCSIMNDCWFVRLFNSQATVSRKLINGGMCFAAMLTFLPTLLPPTHTLSLDDFPMLFYDPYKLAVAINVALTVPMLIDTILDNMNSMKVGAELLRVAVAVTLFLPTLLVLWFCFGDSPRFLLFFSLVVFQQAVLYGFIFQILNFHDSAIWTDVRVALLVGGHVSGWTFYAMAAAISPVFWVLSSLIHALNLLHFLCIIMFLWLPKYAMLFRTALAVHAEKAEATGSRFHWLTKYIFAHEGSVYSFMTADEAVSIFYVILSTAMITITLLPLALTEGFLLGSYAQSAFIVLLTVYPGRVARQKAKKSDSDLKSKKAFVQYISHEARGPLSVASMGLELHLMDLRSAMKHDVGSAALANSDSRNDWLSRRCVHVNEVMDSCNAAQHILNDLLTYDKIESGMLQMERDVLPILPFLDREFSPYSIQSRYKNITVHYNWKEGKIHSSYDKICVMADKHKLAQVFRNLLSNALKFTPVDGQINVDVKILCLLQAGDGGADSAPLLMDSWMPSPKAAPSPVASTCKGTTTPWSTDVDLTATATSTRASRRQQSDRDNSRVVRYCQSHSNTSASAINNSASTVGGAEDFYVDITEVDFANLDRVVLDMVCRVEVRDSGPGIKKENMSQLFGKYVQFDAAQMQQGGGSGLGLWLSKSLVELHGGQIGCTSSGIEGKGSTFYFELPIDHIQLTDSEQEVAMTSSQGVSMGSIVNISMESMGTEKASDLNSGVNMNAADNQSWISPQAVKRTAEEKAEAKLHARSARIAPLTVDSEPRSATEERHHPDAEQSESGVRKAGLWNKHAKLQSDMNALLSSNIELSSATPDMVLMSSGVSSSASGRPRNSSLRRSAEKLVLLNVLVVDDTPLSRKMMRRAFVNIVGELGRGLRINVHEGTDGTEAIVKMNVAARGRSAAAAEEDAPVYYDLLFIDSEMGEVSGAEAIRTIRQQIGFSGPIYGVTGHATAEELARLTEAGATAVYTKPVSVGELKKLVEACLKNLAISKMASFKVDNKPTSPSGSGKILSSGLSIESDPSYNSLGNSSDAAAGDRSNFNVMVVDDTPMHRKMMIRALKSIEASNRPQIHFNIFEGEDGSDAIDMIVQSNKSPSAHKYDIIFIDYDMANINGAVAIKSVREEHNYAGKIYAVTANENPVELQKLRDAGATDIFIKPLRVEQLKVLTATILECT